MTDIEFRSEMTVTLVDCMGTDDSVIRAMLVSTKGADSIEAEATPGRINFLMRNRHGTPFEHASMTFYVEAPIAVFREWHRHRIGQSYNEMSARYKEMAPVFYVPPRERPLVQVGKPGHYTFVPASDEHYEAEVESFKEDHTYAYRSYQRSLERGTAKEVARGRLPVYLFSSMYVTLNPRSLMAFLSLRSTIEGAIRAGVPIDEDDQMPLFPSFPMWEIEQCALPMEQQFAQLFPLTHRAFREYGSVSP